MRALSLGAGVQSTAVLLMSIYGDLDPFDVAVFADTHGEPTAVYDHLERLRQLPIRPRIIMVSAGNLATTVLPPSTFTPIPLHDGHGGMGQRQCTNQYKLRPIRRYLRSVHRTWDLSVCISTDEIERAKDSGLRWCHNRFPLLDLGWSRSDCEAYLKRSWPHPVPRSACVYCPLKSSREWLDMRENRPDDWAAAVAFDEAARPFGYVHRSARPLAEAVLRPEDAGQLALECEGMCGV